MIQYAIELKCSLSAFAFGLGISLTTGVVDDLKQLAWHVFMSLVGGIVTWIVVRRLNKRFK